MGIFGKGRRSREEKAEEIVGQIAEGKGFYGRMTKAFVGGQDFAAIQQSIAGHRSAGEVQQLLAAGAPTVPAVVVSIADTGRLVNYDPVVDLVVRPSGPTQDQLTLRTLVSKLQIPRAGDQVLLLPDPANPGGFLYAGLA
ncbi:hypothetical protein AB0D08_02630 [Kitasatospora sp. NPDC048540]|uniref:hypothetical protein n=1 Tax=unclassified Kitasatospora TaxID=2633591 RepID=UPI00053B7F67|nr:hypothetical protein [Kitasatospora sp. MBT63]